MRWARRTARDIVIWAAFTCGIVALVFGQTIIGGVLLAFSIWQFVLAAKRGSGLFIDPRDVDQRRADRPGPNPPG